MTIPEMLAKWKSVNLEREVPIITYYIWFMATVSEMLSRANSIGLRERTSEIIQSSSKNAADLNRGQLKRGIDSEGDKITPSYYSLSYAIDKNNKNSLPGFGTPDLFQTGAFSAGIYSQVVAGKKIIFGSTDFKSLKLVEKYGAKIFGLTKENKKTYSDKYIKSNLLNYVKNTLKGKKNA